jgi:hypothetical protein
MREKQLAHACPHGRAPHRLSCGSCDSYIKPVGPCERPVPMPAHWQVSRTDGKMFEKMHRTIKMYRQDVAILDLSSRVVAAARKLLVAYRVRLCQQGFGPYGGGSTPSSGCDASPP